MAKLPIPGTFVLSTLDATAVPAPAIARPPLPSLSPIKLTPRRPKSNIFLPNLPRVLILGLVLVLVLRSTSAPPPNPPPPRCFTAIAVVKRFIPTVNAAIEAISAPIPTAPPTPTPSPSVLSAPNRSPILRIAVDKYAPSSDNFVPIVSNTVLTELALTLLESSSNELLSPKNSLFFSKPVSTSFLASVTSFSVVASPCNPLTNPSSLVALSTPVAPRFIKFCFTSGEATSPSLPIIAAILVLNSSVGIVSALSLANFAMSANAP